MSEWNSEFYKTGYEGFERRENFPTADALSEYRRHLIEKSAQQAQLIQDAFGGRRLRVLEIGAGNGRLLVALAVKGAIESATGIEISRSRVEFGREWIQDLGLDSVELLAADALSIESLPENHFDLAVCITGAFGYFGAIRESGPSEILRRIHHALRGGGKALFELYQLPEERRRMMRMNGGRLRTWHPLPPEDRFAYYLDDLEYFETANALRHGKIFIGRDGSIDAGREEVLTYYTRRSFSRLLVEHGFTAPGIWGDFGKEPYREGKSATMVALAGKRRGKQ